MLIKPFGRIGVRHGQGDALPLVIGAQNDELPRFGLGRNLGGFYPVADDGALGHFAAFHYLKHTNLSSLQKIYGRRRGLRGLRPGEAAPPDARELGVLPRPAPV